MIRKFIAVIMLRSYMFLSLFALNNAANFLYKENPLIVRSCEVGKKIENACYECLCTDNEIYECTPKVATCNEEMEKGNSTCDSNIIYAIKDMICICDRKGQWPHEQCSKTLKSFTETKQKCKPNSYFVNDCNVCRCGPNGEIDKSHCTRNTCKPKDKNKSRRFSKQSNVYGTCEIKNWYSLAPCQFCFCVNENKLVCNTGNVYSTKLELGAYNLSICGRELIREAIELIPDKQNHLRYGIDKLNKTDETPTPFEESTKKIELLNAINVINVNREKDKAKVNQTKNQYDVYEYYTDSEEYTSPKSVKAVGREGVSTQLPYYVEIPKEFANKRKESQDTDHEIGVEIEVPNIPSQVVSKKFEVKLPNSDPFQKVPDNFNLGDALKLNLPMVLDKVFQMALKKSMISVESTVSCTPGAATILKCNVCFCMKDNKLLCTNNVCE